MSPDCLWLCAFHSAFLTALSTTLFVCIASYFVLDLLRGHTAKSPAKCRAFPFGPGCNVSDAPKNYTRATQKQKETHQQSVDQ
jgi:hypothetical protein